MFLKECSSSTCQLGGMAMEIIGGQISCQKTKSRNYGHGNIKRTASKKQTGYLH